MTSRRKEETNGIKKNGMPDPIAMETEKKNFAKDGVSKGEIERPRE